VARVKPGDTARSDAATQVAFPPATTERWHEWAITTSFVILSLGAVWAVFGDDLAQLVSPAPPESAQKVQAARR
jgi:hypothetical protein